MKNRTTLVLAIGLLVAVGTSGAAQGFQEVLPTIGAYTLRGGEWQIGLPSVLVPMVLSVGYGITDYLQVGTVPILALFGQLHVNGKLRIPLGPNLDTGIPFGVWFYLDPIGFAWGSGAVLSLRLGGGFTFHGGVGLGMVREFFYVRPYAIAGFDLLPNLKLVEEFGFIPLTVTIGTWIRVLPFLDVKIALMASPAFAHGRPLSRVLEVGETTEPIKGGESWRSDVPGVTGSNPETVHPKTTCFRWVTAKGDPDPEVHGPGRPVSHRCGDGMLRLGS